MDDDRADSGDSPDDWDKRTPAWYWSRMELGLGIGLVVLAGLSLLAAPAFVSFDPDTNELSRLGTPLNIAAFVGMVAGLVWMIRIFRGPRDELPPWRYRKR